MTQLYKLSINSVFQKINIFRALSVVFGLSLAYGMLLIPCYLQYRRIHSNPKLRYEYNPYLGWDSKPPVKTLKNKGKGPAIFFIGDSFTHDGKWPQYTQDIARKQGFEFEGFSLGVSGYGTIQTYLKLKSLYEIKRPKIVLLLFYAWNDMRDNYQFPPTYYNFDRLQRPFLDTSDPKLGIVPISFGYRLLMKLTFGAYGPFINQVLHSKYASHLDPSYWKPFYSIHERNFYVEGAWSTTENAFKLLIKFLKDRQTTLIVLGIDNAFCVDKDVYDAYFSDSDQKKYSTSIPLIRLENFLNSQNVKFINCNPSLLERTKKMKKKIYKGKKGDLTGHLTKDGDKVVAALAFESIRNYLLKFNEVKE